MRPKLPILLIDNDERRRNVLACVLASKCKYAVLACTEHDLPNGQGKVVLSDVTGECHLAIVRREDATSLCHRLRRSNPSMPILLVGGGREARYSADVNCWLAEHEAERDTAYLLDRIRALALRKRGPKNVQNVQNVQNGERRA